VKWLSEQACVFQTIVASLTIYQYYTLCWENGQCKNLSQRGLPIDALLKYYLIVYVYISGFCKYILNRNLSQQGMHMNVYCMFSFNAG